MARLTRTWWGERFLDVLEHSMDRGRLMRGRSYSGPARLLKFDIVGTTVTAQVRGNVNAYFGVKKEPRYKASVTLKQFSVSDWDAIIGTISQNTAYLSQLLVNEMPPTIENVFALRGLNLLPQESADLLSTCSCPDYASPCKHVAGVYYKVASLLDRDPLLLFQLRGMTFAALRKKLAAAPLGQALLDQMDTGLPKVEYRSHRYTNPRMGTLNSPDIKSYWQGRAALPSVNPVEEDTLSPAMLILKGGHLPKFWEQNGPFIDAMETLYLHILTKNKSSL